MQEGSDAVKQTMISGDMEHALAGQMDITAFRETSQEAYDKLNPNEARKAVYEELGKEIIK